MADPIENNFPFPLEVKRTVAMNNRSIKNEHSSSSNGIVVMVENE